MLKGVIGFITAFLFSFSIFISDAGTSEEAVSLQFLQPAGFSPKIFTEGWVFGANCLIPSVVSGRNDFGACGQNITSQVHWTGTGKFIPEYGPETRPVFDREGENTITASVTVNGKTYSKTLTVSAVLPDYYARIGDYVFCGADNHGCPSCPHPVSGQIFTGGSTTVTVRGKPAARVGDGGIHLNRCCGENTFVISEGDNEVLIDGKPAAKIGSATVHCGGTGTGIIIGDDIRNSENTKEKSDKNSPKYEAPEVDTRNVCFPGELVPKSYVKRLAELKQRASAQKYLAMEGPDYEMAKTDMIDKIGEIFGLESASLNFIQEATGVGCLENINKYCGRIGIAFSVMEVVTNLYEGKKTEAVFNTLKSSAYLALDYSWSTLKIASIGIVVIDYTLKKFMKEMLDSRYDVYKRGFYKYYNEDTQVKRDHKTWRNIAADLYEKSKNGGQEFQDRLNAEMDEYLSRFWNPEVYAFYLPTGGLTGEVNDDDKKLIQESYKKEILAPILNAVCTAIIEKERQKIEKDIADDTQKLTDNFNAKIPFTVRVKGSKDKIAKMQVKIGEWMGYTDKDGIWKFDATVYAYAKNRNKTGKPLAAVFVVGENDEREVEFQLKNKVEIEFNLPKPVTLSLDLTLSKDTEGAGYSAIASANNFDKYTIPNSESGVKVEWVWKINGAEVNSFEGGLELGSSNISGTFDEAGDYTVEVSLVNKTESSPGFSKPLAVATKKVTVKKDRTKEKEKEKEIVITKKEEEPKKKEEEKKKEVETYYEHSIPMNGGYANYNYKKEYTIQVFVPVGDRGKFSDDVYKWTIKEGWDKVVSEFSGKASFIFPYHNGSFYVIECRNSSGTVTFSKPLRLE